MMQVLGYDVGKMLIGVFFALLFVSGSEGVVSWTTPSGISGSDGTATATVPEDKAVGSEVISVTATGGGAISYSIEEQPTTAVLEIATASSGSVTVAAGKSFDYETAQTYVIKIKATDASDSSTGVITYTVTITNVYEAAPTFKADQYTAAISDGSKEGAAVITVAATDTETSQGDSVTYSITGGNTNSAFKIDGTSGKITVNTGKTLDAGTLGGYMLEVTATDENSNTDTTTVWVLVKTCSGSGTSVVSIVTVIVAVMTSSFM